ncbi:MAG: cysteine methyltransferase [Gammaproteobacteria bacterium]|jgi:AraC family transcriptional regulator of adaptative response/methylated-DNA-[protein]-cysteine methyltransferase|nr:cysteine methyltransferase [Gammaproteobacteria bacterium]
MRDTQAIARHESANDFKDTFSHLLGSSSRVLAQENVLTASWFDTPLGPMVAIADDHALYLLEFFNRCGLEHKVESFKQKTKAMIVSGYTAPIYSIKNELSQYFEGRLKTFITPLCFLGSPFQKQVWQALQNIPYGQTLSYAELAKAIGRPTAFRAVAQANATNQLALIVPCHRVINTNGHLGGYASGVIRKEWLIHHEKRYNT